VSRLEARLEDDPDDLSGWLTLARARWTQGQTEAGLEALERARSRFEDNAGALALISAMRTAFSVEESEQ
jgi:cytochrome c-type biogenesis protein CcmH